MSKIVFFCIPAHGHTNPTLEVVRQLVYKGHEVWYYSYNIMRDKIEASGAKFISCDDYNINHKLKAKDSARIGKDLVFSTKILIDTTLALDDKLCREIEKLNPDCIVADSMALWGKAIALKLKIPFISSTTTFAFNKYSVKTIKQGFGDLLKMLVSLPRISKQVKRLKERGYPVKSILDIIGNDDNTNTIVYTSPQFQPESETFSDKFTFTGPSIRSSEEEFKKDRDKLIYISMGTVNNDMMPFYKTCISAFKDTCYEVIMSVGSLVNKDDFGKLPENISVFSEVDQIAVLKKADAFISHAGMNSVSESLYFEVPLVMIPQTAEQTAVAKRVFELGAGIILNKPDKKSLLISVEQILGNNDYKKNAKIISDGFRKCLGANGAAEKILEICNNKN